MKEGGGVGGARWPRGTIAALAAVGVLASLGVAWIDHRRLDHIRELRREDQAHERIGVTRRELERAIDAVHSLADLHASSQEVTAAEFALFTVKVLERNPAIQVLEWAPRVGRAERAGFEASARVDGLAGYVIREQGAGGALLPAAERDEYFPVRYAAPAERNRQVFGFDLGSSPASRAAIEQARRGHGLTLSGAVQVSFADPAYRAVLVVAPVFARQGVDRGEGQGPIEGVYVGVLRVDLVVDLVRSAFRGMAFEYRVIDRSAAPGDQLLFDSRPGAGPDDDPDPVGQDWRRMSDHFPVGGRDWVLACWPGPDPEDRGWSPESLVLLAAGLLLTFGACARLRQHQVTEARLRQAAYCDALTGLPNRAQFLVHLDEAQKALASGQGPSYTVLFIDLDRFKLINDSLGHNVGDELLVAVARRLEQCLRPGDRVARIGGDEFTVLLDGVGDPAQAAGLARDIDVQLRRPFRLESGEALITASIGIATHDHALRQAHEILRNSDIAMDRAKRAGSQRYMVFDETMRQELVMRQSLERDLRRALESDQMQLYYQPLVALGSGELVGFEALARWQHPQFGLLSPVTFISLAEETGLIVSLGERFLREAGRQAAQWNRWLVSSQRKPLRVHVNISNRQMAGPDALRILNDVVEAAQLPTESLAIEITESIVVEDVERIADFLRRLRERGIHVCIDDFGTGYSSLSYLHLLPVDGLKIDKSFVHRLGLGAGDTGLVDTMLVLAHQLGLTVTAEGIETDHQLAVLKSMRCDYGQGYLFSPPVTVGEATVMLERGAVAVAQT